MIGLALTSVASLGLVAGIAWGAWMHLRRRHKEHDAVEDAMTTPASSALEGAITRES